MLRDTFENWQSEFLQLLWQVVGLAYFLYIGSPSSKENDDRMEAKVDALMRMVGGDKAQELIDQLDSRYLRKDGHAKPHGHDADFVHRGGLDVPIRPQVRGLATTHRLSACVKRGGEQGNAAWEHSGQTAPRTMSMC
jgi:hypothetical protein